MAIDTADLSEDVYQAIMVEAEMFNHDLTLQFGLLSGECKDEDDFINKSASMIQEMKNYNENDVDFMFFGNPPPMNDFHDILCKIQKNIDELR